MTKLVAQLFLLILAQWVSGAAIAGESMAGIEDRWLMLVATRCTDPAREAQFNAWYDDIDIPRRAGGARLRKSPTRAAA